jgi:peptidoglycan/xylan/chitin deacetylase (PgdA/CDA1 family)
MKKLEFTIYRWEVLLAIILLISLTSIVKISPGFLIIKNEVVGTQSFQQQPPDKVKIVALTFDDGPYPGCTEELLEILRSEGVKATFFFTGKMSDLHKELVLETYRDGHEVGNHTYSHLNLTKLGTEKIKYEIESTSKILSQIVNKPINIFRPPGGNYNERVVNFIKENGYIMVLWTFSPNDYNLTSEKVLYNRILKNLSGKDIILLHSGVETTCKALPKIIKTLKQQGYKFVTVSEYISMVSQSKDKTWANYLVNAEGKIYKKTT